MNRPDRIARMAQDFETPQGRALEARMNADRGYRNWRLALFFCAACTAAIIAMLAGMLAWHIMTVTAANLAAPMEGKPW